MSCRAHRVISKCLTMDDHGSMNYDEKRAKLIGELQGFIDSVAPDQKQPRMAKQMKATYFRITSQEDFEKYRDIFCDAVSEWNIITWDVEEIAGEKDAWKAKEGMLIDEGERCVQR